MGAKTANQTAPLQRGLVYRIGIGILTLLSILVVLISALPVVLLFFITAVPVWIAALLVIVDVGVIVALFRTGSTPLKLVGAPAAWLLVAVLAVFLSQQFAMTPPITDAAGNVVPGSIATLETVELNGSQQWISIRGHSSSNPVLLFLAGGPGGSELAMTRLHLPELEQHFVVVNWDQPGTGKSYNAVPIADLTPQRYIEDGIALTEYLIDRFGVDRVYILGESWGSILGIWLAQARPELYHAFISTGQMVNTTQTDIAGYEFAINYLMELDRVDQADALRRQGPPPYTGPGMALQYNSFLNVLHGYMARNAPGEGHENNLMFDSLGAPEYGLLDKFNWLLGLVNTFEQVYPQLADLDFTTQAARLDVPVYFVKGSWDVNAMYTFTQEYYDILDAPHTELIWFPNSGHTPLWDSPAAFSDVMINTVLPQTQGENTGN